MKAKRYVFTKAYLDWTTENWRKVLFSDESTVKQFTSRKQLVRKLIGARYEDCYTMQIMKHPPCIVVWGAMSAHGTAGLYFLHLGSTMTGEKYRKPLKDK